MIKRLSYRDQFDKPIVDNVGLGVLLDETIAKLKEDTYIINNIMEVLEYYHDKMNGIMDGIDVAIDGIKRRFFNKEDEDGKMDGNQ